MANVGNSIFEMATKYHCKLSTCRSDFKTSRHCFVFIVRGGVKIKEQFKFKYIYICMYISVVPFLLFCLTALKYLNWNRNAFVTSHLVVDTGMHKCDSALHDPVAESLLETQEALCSPTGQCHFDWCVWRTCRGSFFKNRAASSVPAARTTSDLRITVRWAVNPLWCHRGFEYLSQGSDQSLNPY